MNTFALKFEPKAVNVTFTKNALHVLLADGREVFAPLEWFPRLLQATSTERKAWRFIGNGMGIHWEAIDEDISIASLLGQWTD